MKHAGQVDDPHCDYCGQLDSIRHRLLECPFFRDCREGCRLSVEDLSELPPAQLLHGWARKPDSLMQVREALATTEAAFDVFNPFPPREEYHVFLDGSCLRPKEGPLSLASWATLIASPDSLDQPVLLSEGVVPGLLQSAFRAELCAMLSAMFFCLKVGCWVCAWSDCLGVVRRVRRFLEGSWLPSSRTRHADLWQLVVPFQSTLARWFRVSKVTSHLDPDQEVTAGDEWCAHYNNLADKAAERAQTMREQGFLHRWSRLCQEWDQQFYVAKEVAALHVRVGHKATRHRVSHSDMVPQPAPQPDWTGSLGELGERDRSLLERKYGTDFVRDLQSWSVLLVDPTAQVRWISSVQLFFGFCLRFRRPPVFKDNKWQDLQTSPNGRLVPISTAVWVRYFLRQVRDFATRSGGSWRLTECRPNSAALQIKLSCIPLRMQDALWDEVETFLARNLPQQAISGHQRTWRGVPPP